MPIDRRAQAGVEAAALSAARDFVAEGVHEGDTLLIRTSNGDAWEGVVRAFSVDPGSPSIVFDSLVGPQVLPKPKLPPQPGPKTAPRTRFNREPIE